MKVLQVHNLYQYKGGEEVVCEQESRLLQTNGHQVKRFHISPVSYPSFKSKLTFILGFFYNFRIKKDILKLLQEFKPDIVHVHKIFPSISPSVFDACKEAGVPCIMTLHNFRFLIPDGVFKPGEAAKYSSGKSLLGYILSKRYRNSYLYSLGATLWVVYNRVRRSWNSVDGFILPSIWMKEIYMKFGIVNEKLFIKPHFTESLYTDSSELEIRNKFGFVYVGRLSEEKGIIALVKEWKEKYDNIPLTIIGTGPAEERVRKMTADAKNIKMEGFLSQIEIQKVLPLYKALICPSQTNESFGMVVIESFAAGTPVIGSDLHALSEIITDGHDGFLFNHLNIGEVGKFIKKLETNDELLALMCQNSYDTFIKNYSPRVNYYRYIEIIRHVMENYKSEEESI
ncbi:MAG: glycosyltransferase family 4 protein [Balneolaceae bacterium]